MESGWFWTNSSTGLTLTGLGRMTGGEGIARTVAQGARRPLEQGGQSSGTSSITPKTST